mmetsp:Transcript_21903/g.43476  ORF Transcript_21903/g.43476 Transcript_21903/m.43476 type:complete len:107 (+) Transcript_21903:120-440(+)
MVASHLRDVCSLVTAISAVRRCVGKDNDRPSVNPQAEDRGSDQKGMGPNGKFSPIWGQLQRGYGFLYDEVFWALYLSQRIHESGRRTKVSDGPSFHPVAVFEKEAV